MNLTTLSRSIGGRLLFVLATTAVLVFVSEKVYWYPAGYPTVGLILFYAFPAYVTLWGLAYFRVQHAEALILIAALYAFLVEGVLTPVIFEGGFFDLIMPAYFIGWHGLLSVVFGWFWVRKMLVNGRWLSLLLGSTLFGFGWAAWSVTYWLPGSFDDFAHPGQWPVADFAIFAFVFALMFSGSHWIMGRGVWPTTFEPTRIEGWLVGGGLLFCYITLSFLAVPWGIVKLGVLLLLVGLPLALYRRQMAPTSYLAQLAGSIKASHLLPLLAMPLAASGTYAALTVVDPDPESLLVLLELAPLGNATLGAAFLLWALGRLGWRLARKRYRDGVPTAVSQPAGLDGTPQL